MLDDEEINEIIITYMDVYSTSMFDLARAIEKAVISKISENNDEQQNCKKDFNSGQQFVPKRKFGKSCEKASRRKP